MSDTSKPSTVPGVNVWKSSWNALLLLNVTVEPILPSAPPKVVALPVAAPPPYVKLLIVAVLLPSTPPSLNWRSSENGAFALAGGRVRAPVLSVTWKSDAWLAAVVSTSAAASAKDFLRMFFMGVFGFLVLVYGFVVLFFRVWNYGFTLPRTRGV